MSEFTRTPADPKHSWTIETALDHLLAMLSAADRRYEQRFEAQQTATEAALMAQRDATVAAIQAADRAVLKAETAAERRFESVNEFRNTLADQQRNLIPRSEVQAMMSGFDTKLASLEKQIDRQTSERVGVRNAWGFVVGGIGVLLAIGTLALRLAGK